jgi:hypothetical protein
LVLLPQCGWNCQVLQLKSYQCKQVWQLPPSQMLLMLLLLMPWLDDAADDAAHSQPDAVE